MHFRRVSERRVLEITPKLQQLLSFHSKVQKYTLGEIAIGVCKITQEKICISMVVISSSLVRRRYISRKILQGSDWDVTLENIFLNNLKDSITFTSTYSHTPPQREEATSTPENMGLEFKIILAKDRSGLKKQDANELLCLRSIKIREEQQLQDYKPGTTDWVAALRRRTWGLEWISR